jgi:hypothetical protein
MLPIGLIAQPWPPILRKRSVDSSEGRPTAFCGRAVADWNLGLGRNGGEVLLRSERIDQLAEVIAFDGFFF